MGLVQFCVLAFATLCVDALTPFRGGSKLFRDHLQQSTNGPSFVNAKEPSGTTSLTTLAATFPQFNFTQPLDHFVDTGFTFPQRYWVSTRHYKTGGPVIVLDGGETSGAGRLSFLDTGIVDILANATNGLGIVLEHRYYGKSVPVQNFTTDSLRYANRLLRCIRRVYNEILCDFLDGSTTSKQQQTLQTLCNMSKFRVSAMTSLPRTRLGSTTECAHFFFTVLRFVFNLLFLLGVICRCTFSSHESPLPGYRLWCYCF